jgi:glutathione S-transferase
MMLLGNAKQQHNVLYSAWFCPFAQRAWIALNELDVPYRLVESLTIDPQTEAYIKDPELLNYNPKGLVPVLFVPNNNNNNDDDQVVYCDSIPILKELYRNSVVVENNNRNNKDSLDQQFQEANDWNRRICSTLYPVLMRQDPAESEQAWKEMADNLVDFANHLNGNNESFYDDQDTPGMIDLTVFPFVHRLYIIEHYKGFGLPETTESQRDAKKKLLAWKERMEARPSVAKTLATRDALIPIYLRYAQGTAKSKVAESVRSGSHAHDV